VQENKEQDQFQSGFIRVHSVFHPWLKSAA